MLRTIVTINGEAFHLKERSDVDQLCAAILDAAQTKPEFIDISIAGDGTKRILVSASSAVKMETIEIPDGDGAAYDAAHSEFDEGYFDYHLR